MGIAFLIVLAIFCICALRLRTCWKNGQIPNGNIEFLGVPLYGFVCVVLGFVEVILGFLWLIGVGR